MAIALTLLADARSRTVDNWTGYVISFYVIAQFWTIRQHVFRSIRAHQGGLAGVIDR